MFNLLSHPGSNPKLAKGDKKGKYLTASLSLAPSKLSGVDLCPHASPACRRACLNMCGRGRFDKTQAARLRKSKLFNEQRQTFITLLMGDIARFVRYCEKRNVLPAVRLNTFSDIRWEEVAPQVFSTFPNVQFYDYTKDAERCMKSYKLPANYHLTFSRSEVNSKDVSRVLRSGKCNVAVVFRFEDKIPPTFGGRPTIGGDDDDLRFADPSGVVVALKAKGSKAKADKSGFVV